MCRLSDDDATGQVRPSESSCAPLAHSAWACACMAAPSPSHRVCRLATRLSSAAICCSISVSKLASSEIIWSRDPRFTFTCSLPTVLSPHRNCPAVPAFRNPPLRVPARPIRPTPTASSGFSTSPYLMAAVVRLRLSVPGDVIEKCVAWLEGYVGHDAESSLRELVAQFRTSTRIQPSPPQLQRRFLSVTARYRHARSNSISPEASARSDCR